MEFLPAGAESQVATLGALGSYLALAMARTLGATLLFTVFIWGRISSGIIRSVLALVVALPVLAPVWHAPDVALANLQGGYAANLLKELALGAALGFLASLPLEAVGVAGNAIDAVRGGGQLPGPSGDNTVFGQLFMVISLWLFAQLGGFWRTIDMIYASYGLWPINRPLPPMASSSLAALVRFLGELLVTVATLAGSVIVLLLVVDATLLVANRLGKRMNVLDLSQSLKNTVLVVTMPIYAMVIVRVVTGQFPALFDLRLLQLAFPR